ncbi:MAG: 6-phosphofructokinase [Bacteroidetes bacterium HGW-Bacteroidetes-21]|jgi:6-phosphofructokinase 1|nr:MAG: 6-phosphofructokinase [Bacteroidetes bacterium HGW-Bacteroidetes-21]
MTTIKNIAVLTSGGDSPGMNAAIRAVVRTGIFNGLNVYGVRHGYHGLINDHITEMKSHHVSNIIQRGGTILKTARSMEFKTEAGMEAAWQNLKKHDINALFVIGGDGSFRGAMALSSKYPISCIGLPGTIDNDIWGTDETIGFDTAMNTVIDAVDKIRDTASSHNRMFLIEVMGRDAGFIAMNCGIAGGAEAVLIPEIKNDHLTLFKTLEEGHAHKKSSNIILVSEGDQAGGAFKFAEKYKDKLKNYDVRISILGHIQRGGSPSAFDRFLASRLGVAAVEAALDGQTNVMAGYKNSKVVLVPLEKAVKTRKKMDKELLHVLDVLNT